MDTKRRGTKQHVSIYHDLENETVVANSKCSDGRKPLGKLQSSASNGEAEIVGVGRHTGFEKRKSSKAIRRKKKNEDATSTTLSTKQLAEEAYKLMTSLDAPQHRVDLHEERRLALEDALQENRSLVFKLDELKGVEDELRSELRDALAFKKLYLDLCSNLRLSGCSNCSSFIQETRNDISTAATEGSEIHCPTKE